MIEESVREKAESFRLFWSELFSRYPQYQLDYSWPSIGTVDLILFPIRGSKDLDEADTILLQGAAAYLAVVAHDIWRTFDEDITATVSVQDHPGFDINLTATGGKHLGGEQRFRVSIYSTICELITSPPVPTPSFADGSRLLNSEGNILSTFAAGLCSGLCPYGVGPWKKLSIEDFKSPLNQASLELAQSSARYYTRNYPIEPQGQNEELYYPHLVLPPIGYNEKFPASRPTAALLSYCKSLELQDNEQALALASNLLKSPDDLLSTAGFVVSAALETDSSSDTVLAFAHSKGIGCSLLRPAYMLARRILEKPDSWFEHLKKRELQLAEREIKREYQLGLLPLLYFNDWQLFAFDDLEGLFHLISWNQANEATALIEDISFIAGPNPSIDAQHAYLQLITGNSERASSLVQTLNEEDDDQTLRFRALQLRGLLAEMAGDYEATLSYFTRAAALSPEDSTHHSAVMNWLLMYHTSQKEYETALAISDKIIAKTPHHVGARLNQLICFIATGQRENVSSPLEELVQLAPNNPRVFSFLKGSLLEEKIEAD